jgi:hypothetical protein
MGTIPDADQVSEMTGTCGDTMSIIADQAKAHLC